MNNSILDILQALLLSPAASQRTLARETGYSLGLVNRALQELSRDGYLEEGRPSSRALQLAQRAAPRRAVILAAGPGMHMVPINTETPKALLRVHGEVLIERLIRQLHEAGVEEIHVVVGYLKEQLEYLTEDFGVKLLVAPDYASKNNLHSLRRAADYLEDAYILPCDLWFAENPFRRTELYSWYMVTDRPDPRSPLRVHPAARAAPCGGERGRKHPRRRVLPDGGGRGAAARAARRALPLPAPRRRLLGGGAARREAASRRGARCPGGERRGDQHL